MQANLLAAASDNTEAVSKVYNVAYGMQTSLNQIFNIIRDNLVSYMPDIEAIKPKYGPFREGDVRHSLADLSRSKTLLGYEPEYDVNHGME